MPVTPTTPKFTGSLSRLSSSSSMFYLDLDVKESRVSVYKTSNTEEKSDTAEVDDSNGSNGKYI